MIGKIWEAEWYVDVRDYRYGYNGKEREERGEFGTLTHYDYGFRVYSPSLGRFWSVDPLVMDYPYYSPYHFAGNTPVQAVDLDGREPKKVVQKYPDKEVYYLTDEAIELIHGVTEIDKETLRNLKIYKRGGILRVPWYSTSSGGGAITIGDEVTLTENFFRGWEGSSEFIKYYDGYYGFDVYYGDDNIESVKAWLDIMSHEAFHSVQWKKYYKGNTLRYILGFIYEYTINFSHDKAPMEKEAELKSMLIRDFISYTGEENIYKILYIEKLDKSDRINQINKLIKKWKHEFNK